MVIPTNRGIGADAEIRESQPTTNFGTSTGLGTRVRNDFPLGDPNDGNDRNSVMYLKFDLSGLAPADAVDAIVGLTYRNSDLSVSRIYDTDGVPPFLGQNGLNYFGIPGANFNESTITYLNAPGLTPDFNVGTADWNASAMFLGTQDFPLIGNQNWLPVGGQLGFSSAALDEFLAGEIASNPNGVAVIAVAHRNDGDATNPPNWRNFNYQFNPKEQITLSSDLLYDSHVNDPNNSLGSPWSGASNSDGEFSPSLILGAPPDDRYYSFVGHFANGSETQSFYIHIGNVIAQVNRDPLDLRTWQHTGTGAGETNAAGDAIAAGGFDSIMSLYKIEGDGSEMLVFQNDDIDTSAGVYDSQVAWGRSWWNPVTQQYETLTDLGAGDYRLDLTAYGGTLGYQQRHWAVDGVLPWSNMHQLTSIDRSGVVTIQSMKAHDLTHYVDADESLIVSGDLVLSGWGLRNQGTVVASRVEVDDSSLELDGGTVFAHEILVDIDAWLMGSGRVVLPENGTLIVRGRASVGNPWYSGSVGALVIAGGDYVLENDGTLSLGINGPGIADYDRLRILDGTASLDGSLDVHKDYLYTPQAGDTFEIITAPERFAATFDPSNVHLPDISSYGLEWAVSYTWDPLAGSAMVLTTYATGTASAGGSRDGIPEPSAWVLVFLAAAALPFYCRHRYPAGSAVAVALVLLALTSSARAGEAYWSLEGWFPDGNEMLGIQFDVGQEITPADPFSLRTWHNGSGTNAAGDYIAPLGFDSVLGLFSGYDTFVTANDDRGDGTLDSQITWGAQSCTWGQFPTCGGAWNPSGLSVGSYHVELEAYSWNLNTRQPHWAVDLVGPADKMLLMGTASTVGTPVLKSLKFGTADELADAGVHINAGQSLVMSGDLVVGDGGYLGSFGLIAAKHVTIASRGRLTLGDATLTSGLLDVSGELSGTGDILLSAAGLLQNSGMIRPGGMRRSIVGAPIDEPGAIVIPTGNYYQTASGTLRVRIGGRNSADVDQLHVYDGVATLGGTLDVQLANTEAGKFQPAVGDSFEILTASEGLELSRFNPPDFAHAPLEPGLDWNIRYTDTSVVLEVIPALPGDYNRNGVVDAADYTVWRDTLDHYVPRYTGADGNGDWYVDNWDYGVWRNNFGRTAAGGSGAGRVEHGIPEPAALLQIVAASGLVIAFRALTTKEIAEMKTEFLQNCGGALCVGS